MNIRFILQRLILLSFLLLSAKVQSEVVEKVISCQLGSKQFATLFRGHRIADTYVYSLQQENNQSLLLYDNEDESRGMDVKAECVGKDEPLWVVSGEFFSNYFQGLVLRYNANYEQWERINFAERARPVFIYVSNRAMSVVIPNQGNETDKKYLIYSYVSGKGQTEEITAVNVLPTIGRQYQIQQ